MTNGTGDVFRKMAQDAIDKKRSQLGGLVGNPSSDLEVVEGGFESFVQQFDNGLDMYFSAGDSEAHEVHGDIKRKYDILAPAQFKATFGLPVTDESPAANNGRFNDFVGDNSIYWHGAIGPRLVSGPIRESWKQQGGEGGTLGYPVKDRKRWPTTNPQTDPVILFSIFQSGDAIVNVPNVPAANALPAKIGRDPLSVLVRKQFDDQFHQQDDTIGFDPGVKIVSVSEWSSDLIESANRVILYRLSGFRSNPVVQDTTFVFDIGLRFRLQMEPAFGTPSQGSLLVEMLPGSLVVQCFGIGADTLQSRLQDGITNAFKDPLVVTDEAHRIPVSDPNGPIILDLVVTPQAELNFLVHPIPTDVGNFRQLAVQRGIEKFLEDSGVG
jgi:hypothetical protein